MGDKPAATNGIESVSKRGLFRMLLTASATGILAGELSAPAYAQGAASESGILHWGRPGQMSHPRWQFAFINHAVTNPFFVPTQNGVSDACALTGCQSSWLGSPNSNTSEMVTAFEAAVRAKVDGIAVSLIDETEFNRPVEEALKAGIPVFAYNSDVSPKSANKRLSYIGQSLFAAGYMLGYRLAALMAGGSIAAFAATPEKLNLKPRADGLAAAIKDWNANTTADRRIELLPIIRSGPVLDGQVEAIRGALLKYPDLRGMAGLDGGTTQSLAEVMQERSLGNGLEGIQAAGFDLLPRTLELLRMRRLAFTIDQQPYLQGFLTTMEMFLFIMSGGMAGAADINTGQEIVTSENVDLYLSNRTRYEGDYATSWTGDGIGPIRISKQNPDGDLQHPLGRERVLVLKPDAK